MCGRLGCWSELAGLVEFTFSCGRPTGHTQPLLRGADVTQPHKKQSPLHIHYSSAAAAAFAAAAAAAVNAASAASMAISLCHKYILYLYLYLYSVICGTPCICVHPLYLNDAPVNLGSQQSFNPLGTRTHSNQSICTKYKYKYKYKIYLHHMSSVFLCRVPAFLISQAGCKQIQCKYKRAAVSAGPARVARVRAGYGLEKHLD